MSTRPADTTIEAWQVQRRVWASMGPAARVQAAIDLSESVREIQIEGILARNPAWTRADAVRDLVAANLGVELPRRP